MTTRLLPKEWLKKAFLKTLWEHTRPGGKLTSQTYGIDSILHRYASTLAQLFKLPNLSPHVRSTWSLTDEEWRAALEGVEELQRDGYIKNDPEQGNAQFKSLTEKGCKCVEQDLANMKVPSVDIDAVLSHKDLADLVREDYLNGKYDAAIRAAMLKVEEAIRAKAAQPAAAFGAGLIRTAIAPNTGLLRHPDAQTPAEHEALLNLFLGANGWFRNPTSHRTVGYQDPHEAAQILGFANLLLDMIDKCL